MVLVAVKSVAPGLLFLRDIAARCVDREKAGSVNNERACTMAMQRYVVTMGYLCAIDTESVRRSMDSIYQTIKVKPFKIVNSFL